MNNKEKQILGEKYISKQLILLNHAIIGNNIYKYPHEFDIISYKKGNIFVTEVRTTTTIELDYNIVFNKAKALTLIRGVNKHYPEAIIQIAFVSIKNNTISKSELYPISLFL